MAFIKKYLVKYIYDYSYSCYEEYREELFDEFPTREQLNNLPSLLYNEPYFSKDEYNKIKNTFNKINYYNSDKLEIYITEIYKEEIYLLLVVSSKSLINKSYIFYDLPTKDEINKVIKNFKIDDKEYNKLITNKINKNKTISLLKIK